MLTSEMVNHFDEGSLQVTFYAAQSKSKTLV